MSQEISSIINEIIDCAFLEVILKDFSILQENAKNWILETQ